MAFTGKGIRPGLKVAIIGGFLLVAMLAASLGMYIPARTSQNSAVVEGEDANPDRVDVSAWITRVDTAAGTVSVSISDLLPRGALADDSGFLREDARLYVPTSLTNLSVPLKHGEVAPDIEQRFALTGVATDYPFDRYTTNLDIHVLDADGTELPTAVTLFSTDSFFSVRTAADTAGPGGVSIDLTLKRSTPTVVYALFIMVLMLGLAIAAATAAYYVLRGRRGLLFPACSMMAAMLFALVPLRNAVPGDPPIGSVIDFGSFFVAEIVISVSLIAGVVIGHHIERGKERAGGRS
ncbi:MAG: DUF4436 family protein [Mycobacterium sp.]